MTTATPPPNRVLSPLLCPLTPPSHPSDPLHHPHTPHTTLIAHRFFGSSASKCWMSAKVDSCSPGVCVPGGGDERRSEGESKGGRE